MNPATVVPGAFELLSAGVDGTFGTGDDHAYAVEMREPYGRGNVVKLIVTDGPLRDGQYRFTMSATVTDVVGNTLDGNGDAAGGDSYVQAFAVDLPAEDKTIPFAPWDDGSLAKATPLTLTADPATPTLLSGRGRDSLRRRYGTGGRTRTGGRSRAGGGQGRDPRRLAGEQP